MPQTHTLDSEPGSKSTMHYLYQAVCCVLLCVIMHIYNPPVSLPIAIRRGLPSRRPFFPDSLLGEIFRNFANRLHSTRSIERYLEFGVKATLTPSPRDLFLISGNRMGCTCTGWLASQSDRMFMTYKVVHIEGMDVDFCFHKKIFKYVTIS